jgi:hypothetical protein
LTLSIISEGQRCPFPLLPGRLSHPGVIVSVAHLDDEDGAELAKVVEALAQRWFLTRDVMGACGDHAAAAALGDEHDARTGDKG